MPDYSKGKQYSLRSHQTPDIYIGSTIQSLSVRFGGHKRHYKNFLKGSHHYITSFEIIKFDDCYIELIENYPCESKEELDRREGKLIREMDCVNKNIAGRTSKEYYIDNKEKILEYLKGYREDNKEELKEKEKKYRKEHKEEMRERCRKYYGENKEELKLKMKEYRVEHREELNRKYNKWYGDHKEEIAEKKKKYRKEHKEEISERKAQKYTCPCGAKLTKTHKARHERSLYHQAWLAMPAPILLFID